MHYLCRTNRPITSVRPAYYQLKLFTHPLKDSTYHDHLVHLPEELHKPSTSVKGPYLAK